MVLINFLFQATNKNLKFHSKKKILDSFITYHTYIIFIIQPCYEFIDGKIFLKLSNDCKTQ